MHLARSTYIWAFIAVLLGSTFAQPSSENAIRNRSPNTLRRRSRAGPPRAGIKFEELKRKFDRHEWGDTAEDREAWQWWYSWVHTCARNTMYYGTLNYDQQLKWCNKEYWRRFEDTEPQRPDLPEGRVTETPPKTIGQRASGVWRKMKGRFGNIGSFFRFVAPETSPRSPAGPVQPPRIPAGFRR